MVVVATLQTDLTANTAPMERGFTQANQLINQLSANSGAALRNFTSLTGAIAAGNIIASAFTGAVSNAVSTLMDLGKSALSLGSRLEQARIGFTNMLGSAEAADKFVRQLQAFAENTAFDFPGIQQVAQSFMAMGFEAKNVIPVITDVSNALSAAGHGGDTAMLQRVGMSLSEIAAQGKISGEQLRELARNGIAVMPMLAHAFGVTTAEVKKMAESGQISAKMFFEAFHSETAQRYGDVQAQQAQTWAVAISNVGDIIGRLTTETLQELFGALTQGALTLQDFLKSDRVRQWAGDMKATIHEVMVALAPLGQMLRTVMGLGPAKAPVAAAPKPAVVAPEPAATKIPSETIQAAAAYKAQIAGATAELHGTTAALTELKGRQDELKGSIEDINRTYELQQRGLKDQQEAIGAAIDATKTKFELQQRGIKDQQEAVNASIDATKEKYEGILAPMERAQDQLSRLAENTRTEFQRILDPLKDALADTNREIEDTKAHFAGIADPLKTALDETKQRIQDVRAGYEEMTEPLKDQISAIDKANSALQKQHQLEERIADIKIRQATMAAQGDPAARGEIARQMKLNELAQDELGFQIDLAEAGTKKGDKNKDLERLQEQAKGLRVEEIHLQQQALGLVDRAATAELEKQQIISGSVKEQNALAQAQADLNAEQQKAPLQAQLEQLEAQFKSVMDPLEAQQRTLTTQIQATAAAEKAALEPLIQAQSLITRQIEDTSRAEEASMRPIIEAQAELARNIQDVNQAQKDALKPLEDQQKALAAQLKASEAEQRAALAPLEDQQKAIAKAIKESEASQRAALAPLKEQQDALEAQSRQLEQQKRLQTDKIQGWKDEAAAIKARNEEQAKGAAGAGGLDLSGGVEPPEAPPLPPGESLISAGTLQNLKDFATAIAGAGAAIDEFNNRPSMVGLRSNLASIGEELGKLTRLAAGAGGGLKLVGDNDIDDIIRLGSTVAGVVANILDSINTLSDAFHQFGLGLSHLVAAAGKLMQGDLFGAAEQQRQAGEAFAAIPKLIADEQERARARMAGETPKFAAVARDQFGGIVVAANEALAPMAPTVEQNLAAAEAQFPAIAAAVAAEQGPMGIAATGLGEALTVPVAASADAAVLDATTTLPGVPAAVTAQQPGMTVAATTLGTNLTVPLATSTAAAVEDATTELPGVPKAVTDQHAVMTSASTTLGQNLVDPLNTAGLNPAVENANRRLPEVPAAVVAQQAPMLTESTKLGASLPTGIDAGIDSGKAKTEQNLGDWIKGLTRFFDPLGEALERIGKALSNLPNSLPSWMAQAGQWLGLGGGGGKVSGRNAQYIMTSASKYGVDAKLIAALQKVENSGDTATSKAGAYGPMQVMPDKYLPGENRADLQTNFDAAARYIKALTDMFGNDLDKIAAGYFGTGTDATGMTTGRYAELLKQAYAEQTVQIAPQSIQQISMGISGGLGELIWPVVPGGTGVATNTGTHATGVPGLSAIDIFAPAGSPINAPVGGTSQAGFYSLGGNATIIAGDDGKYYYFAHALEPFVGGRIEAGQQIGMVGATGNAAGTPPHLHAAVSTDPGTFGVAGAGTGNVDPSFLTGTRMMQAGGMGDLVGPADDLTKANERLAASQTLVANSQAATAIAQARARMGLSAIVPQTQTLAQANTALGQSNQAAALDLQYNSEWVQTMAAQQATLSEVLKGQVDPATILTTDAMRNFGAVLGPIERQVAAGAISMDTLQFSLVDAARATGLATKPWNDYSAGLIDINEAMARTIIQSADAGPQFEALRQEMGTTNTVTDALALKYLQLALNYGQIAPAATAAAAAQATVAGSTSTLNNATNTLNSSVGTVNQTIDPAIYTQSAEAANTLTGSIAKLQGAFGEMAGAAAGAHETLAAFDKAAHSLADFLDDHTFHVKIEVDPYPSEFKPGSPTPFEEGLRGIADAEGMLNRIHLRGLRDVEMPSAAALQQSVADRGSGGGSTTIDNSIGDISIPGFIGTKDELVDAFHDGLLRKKRHNGRLGLGDND